MSRGEAGVTPYWTGVGECDSYEGNVALARTRSDEQVNSLVCAPGPDGQGSPCNDSLTRTGSDEPPGSGSPCNEESPLQTEL